MRYFFHIGYVGTNYNGWQKHPDGVGIQEIIEKTLCHIFKKPVWAVGCGRTDAKVHASQFFFHSDISEAWDFDLIFRLNKLLPDDIAVFDIIPMEGLPHARFDAVQRAYDYFIHTYKDPFLSNISSYYAVKEWDIANMKRAAALLLNYNNYHAFCKMPDRNTHTICHITKAMIYTNNEGDKLRFHISANRFLGKMVRIIVGKLIDIGAGNLTVDEFEAALINPHKVQTIKPAYPQGLYLSKVTYPYLNIPPGSNFVPMLANDTGEWNKM